MQNPPAPEPSNTNAPGPYDAYPSAASAGAPVPPAPSSEAPAPSYSPAYAQQPPAYDAQGYAAPAYSAPQQQPVYAQAQTQGAGFFKALFDLSFTNYITIGFAKFIYIALVAVCVLMWLFLVITGFSEGALPGLAALLFGWIPALFYIIIVRLSLEVSVALIRTAQNTSELVAQNRQG